MDDFLRILNERLNRYPDGARPGATRMALLKEALAEAGFAIVPIEPTPEAVAAWWRVKNGHHFHDEPPPEDTSDYAAYRALVRAAAGVDHGE